MLKSLARYENPTLKASNIPDFKPVISKSELVQSMLVICPWYLGGSPTPPLITSPTIGKLDETGPHFHIKGCDSVESGNFDEFADSGESGHSG